jgi:phosphoglycolate phosphatase-like HAD superfamily hydrolase
MVVMVTLLSCARHVVVLAVVMLACTASDARAQSDPLPSWNDGAVKQAILDFVARVTREGGPDHVPPAERIAVFDNDGTLWAEQPVYVQAAFARDRIKALAPQHPEWKVTQPYKGVIDGDAKAIADSGEKGITEILAVSHAGMTTEAFAKTVADWLATARHPRFRQPYDKLAYLRARQFKTFIVSGGGVEFMRVFAETTYGIPPEQVVGSSGVVKFELGGDGKPALVKQAKIEFVDDGPGKPVGINRFIGRRPILAFGNSDGDHQMLQYVMAGPGPRFAGIVHHTDHIREYAYDRPSKIGQLDKAWDEAKAKGWTIVDMARDWRKVFAFEP